MGMWQRVVYPTFLFGKTWFLFTLMLFVTSQSILEYINDGRKGLLERSLVFACRTFIYFFSMTQLIYCHSRDTFKAFRSGTIFQLLFLWVPCYLKKWQEAASLALGVSLFIMLSLEPVLRCFRHSDLWFDADCENGRDQQSTYEFFSMTAMFLYYLLLIDFAAISTRISAFVLTCIRMQSQVRLYLGGIIALILTFSSAISVLKHDSDQFAGIFVGTYSLARQMLGMFDATRYADLEAEPAVFFTVIVFLISSVVFLTSLLIAQLNCAYSSVYNDMVGYARLERGTIIVEMMPNVPKARWYKFSEGMQFSKRLEFNAGDIGLAGGMQVREASNLNPMTSDCIKRFGGSTSMEIQWPAEEETGDNETDRFEKIERLMQQALKRVTAMSGGARGAGKGSGSGSGSGSGGQNRSGSSGSASDES